MPRDCIRPTATRSRLRSAQGVAVNLIEAIKSGRPFRYSAANERRSDWMTLDKSGSQRLNLPVHWITGDCWETQEAAVTITRTQFWEVAGAVLDDYQGNMARVFASSAINVIAMKLGLEVDK